MRKNHSGDKKSCYLYYNMVLSVAFTGAEPGDILMGYDTPVTEGCVIKLMCTANPMSRKTNKLTDGDALGCVSRLKKMSPSERLAYVKSKAEDGERHIGHGCGIAFEVLQVGPGVSERLGDLEAGNLVGKMFTTIEFEKLFIDAGTPTLFLIKGFWRVSEDFNIQIGWKGIVLDIEAGKLVESCDSRCFVYNGFSSNYVKKEKDWVRPAGAVKEVALMYPGDLPCKSALDLAESMGYDTCLKAHTRGFTPAAYKSLMQKIIRFRPENVGFLDGTRCKASDGLVTCLALLADHIGSFVPDIQRFVGGLESMAKRLAICIYEDSYGEPEWLMSLLSGALLAQLDRSWRPPASLFVKWFEWGLAALESPKKLDVDFLSAKDDKPFVIDSGASVLQNCSAILDVLKAFHCDYGLTRGWITRCKGEIVSFDRPEVMPLGHCVDHHWAPHLCHLFPAGKFKNHGEIIERIWVKSSRINSRCGLVKPCEMVACAQAEFLRRMNGVVGERGCKDGEYETFEVELDDSWLAGMVGPMEINVSPKMIATVNTKCISEILVIKKPSRDVKTSDLTEKQRERGVQCAMNRLENGVKCRGGVVRRCNDGVWLVDGVEWDVWRVKRIEFPVHDGFEGSGMGLVDPCKDYCSGWDVRVLRRSLMYLSHYRGRFELKKISRDGKGSDVIDCEVYRYFEFLHKWVPGAIEPTGVGKYKVPNMYLLMVVRQYIEEYLHDLSGISNVKWNIVEDPRPLWKHQVGMVSDLLSATSRGSFIWAPVGSGKTKVVMTYLARLVEQGKMPDYVIYTLPKSAVVSVKKEIELFCKDVVVISPLKTSKRREFVKGCVNLVEHDHLRRFDSEYLGCIGSKSLLIVDEVHRTLNETLRTGVAVELGHCACRFVVMTGTPIIDSKTQKLIPWLEQIVDFEVNERNFWVAANGMISCKFESVVSCEYEDVRCDLSGYSEYFKYVPPILGGKNQNPSYDDWRAAVGICREVCDLEMVAKVRELVGVGRRVMLVAGDQAHRSRLCGDLKGLRVHEMIEPVCFDVNSPDLYDVVVVTVRQSEGYTLTKMNAMVTSVYPSNDATRQQLEGRINRIGQVVGVSYHTYHAGVLSELYESHSKARGLSVALSGLAKVIKY